MASLFFEPTLRLNRALFSALIGSHARGEPLRDVLSCDSARSLNRRMRAHRRGEVVRLRQRRSQAMNNAGWSCLGEVVRPDFVPTPMRGRQERRHRSGTVHIQLAHRHVIWCSVWSGRRIRPFPTPSPEVGLLSQVKKRMPLGKTSRHSESRGNPR